MPEEQKTCKICRQPFLGYPMGEKNGYNLVTCRDCGSVFTDPFLTQADLNNFFGDIQPEIVHTPDPAAEIVDIKKMLGKITTNFSGRRFLDISCRQGYAVMAAKELGFQAHGIDPHDFFIAFAKDKYDPALFDHISVPDYAAKGGQAEVIYANECFCEQPDPEAYMAALAKILAPGGKLYLREPDGNNFNLPKNFSNWSFVDPPLNFSYLSEKGMRALLARHGLKVEKKFFTWAPFMRLIVTRKG
jgi:SAM-dependent methyltransferase